MGLLVGYIAPSRGFVGTRPGVIQAGPSSSNNTVVRPLSSPFRCVGIAHPHQTSSGVTSILQCFTRSMSPRPRSMVLISPHRARCRRPENDTKYCEHAIDAVRFAPSAGRSRVRAACWTRPDAHGPPVQPSNKTLGSSSQLGETTWQLEWDDY